MAWIKMNDEPDGDLAGLYDRVRDPESGAVDEIMRVHSLHPRGLRAHFDLYTAVMRPTGTLSKIDRELIALRVSQINECHY